MDKSKQIFFLLVLIFQVSIAASASAESCWLSTNAVYEGGTVKAYWSDFSSNVNLKFYQGSTFLTYANTGVEGTGSQDLVMNGYAVHDDYWVRVELQANTGIYRDSGYFSVNDPTVSLSTYSVEEGGTVKVYWSGFSSNVNLRFYQGSTFLDYANTDVAGTGSQDLVMDGYAAHDDYWVKVELRDNTSIYKDSPNFSVTEPPPAAPSLYLPNDYTIQLNQTPHSFDWSTVSGANLYRIYVDNHDGFGSPEINQTPTNSLLNSYTPLENNVYFWKVQARNSSGVWGNWTTTRRFVVDTPPPAPSLSLPANGNEYDSGTSISFSWSGPTGYSIDRYYLRIVKGTNLDDPPKYHDEFTATSLTVSTSGWEPGTYTWGVRAIKNHPYGFSQSVYETTVGWGDYTTPLRIFTIAEQPFDLTASLSTVNAVPSDGQQGTDITITCAVNKSGGAMPNPGTYVRVYLYLSQDNTSITGAREICGETCAFDFDKSLLADGSESLQKIVILPNDLQGPYYVLAVVDGSEYWAEANENNNLAASPATMAIWQGGIPTTSSDYGILARAWDNQDVYWISKYGKKWKVTGTNDALPDDNTKAYDHFLKLGYTDVEVGWFGAGALASLLPANDILQNDVNFVYRRQGTTPEDSTVFIVRNGVSDWFFNWDTFINSEFGTEDVYWATPVGFDWIQSVYSQGQMIDLQPRIRVEPNRMFFK